MTTEDFNNYMCDNCGEGFTLKELSITDENSLCDFCCPICYDDLNNKGE
jgi:formylmethanofuran dehydrogenase subunit E